MYWVLNAQHLSDDIKCRACVRAGFSFLPWRQNYFATRRCCMLLWVARKSHTFLLPLLDPDGTPQKQSPIVSWTHTIYLPSDFTPHSLPLLQNNKKTIYLFIVWGVRRGTLVGLGSLLPPYGFWRKCLWLLSHYAGPQSILLFSFT